MVIIFIKTTITYFQLKSKIYLKKVAIMTDNTPVLIDGFLNINPTMF